MNACQIDRESHLQNDVRNVQILQKMQCTNEYNEHDAQPSATERNRRNYCATERNQRNRAQPSATSATERNQRNRAQPAQPSATSATERNRAQPAQPSATSATSATERNQRNRAQPNATKRNRPHATACNCVQQHATKRNYCATKRS